MLRYADTSTDIGLGAYATVYTTSGSAVKHIPNYIRSLINPSALREASSLLAVQSPYVVQLEDVVMTNKEALLVLELAERTLDEANLTRYNPIELIKQLCLGVADLHNANIIHADLKPSNLLIKDNRLIIADLGIAEINSCANYFPLTGEFFSVNWRAPELILGAPLDYSSDVWAVGVIAAEILINKNSKSYQYLFEGISASRILGMIRERLGKPSAEDTIILQKYPKYTEYKSIFTSSQHLKLIPDYLRSKGCTELEIDWVSSILIYDPAKRPTVFELLQHPLINSPVVQLSCENVLLSRIIEPVNEWASMALRRKLVTEIIKLSDNYNISLKSLSLAIFLLDYVVANLLIEPVDLELYSLVCLYLAGSFYQWISLTGLLNSYKYTDQQYTDTAAVILTITDFNLTVTTSYILLMEQLKDSDEEVLVEAEEIWRDFVLTDDYFRGTLKVVSLIRGYLN